MNDVDFEANCVFLPLTIPTDTKKLNDLNDLQFATVLDIILDVLGFCFQPTTTTTTVNKELTGGWVGGPRESEEVVLEHIFFPF